MRTPQRARAIQIIASLSLSMAALLLPTYGAFAQYFHGPESVTYDALNERYLISNALSGNIVQITASGDTTFFDTSLARTLGITIVDNILYVAAISGLVTFDLTIDEKIDTTYIPGMVELNDVAADSTGYLYITDSGAGRIYRVRISDHSSTPIAGGLDIPNGILFDARNNRILFCEFIVNATIKELDLDDFSVNTVLSSSFNRFDGLAIDGADYIYVSSWGSSAVFRYDNAFSLPAEMVSSGHAGPADIYFNQQDNILAVPNYYSHDVDFVPITLAGIEGDPGQMPRPIALVQNYPNPFNPSTTIRYHLPEETTVVLRIYDSCGREVRTLVDREQRIGAVAVVWDGRDNSGRPVRSGIYSSRLQAEAPGIIGSGKMVVVR